MKKCSRSFSQKLKDINSGLFCSWNGRFKKWQIFYKDPKTSLLRTVRFLQTSSGQYLDYIDSRVDKILYEIRTTIPWDLVQKYETTEEILDEVDRINKEYEDKMEAEEEARKIEIVNDTMGGNSLAERFGTWN